MSIPAEQVQTMREGVTLTIARCRKRLNDRLMDLDNTLRVYAGEPADFQRLLGVNVKKMYAEIELLAVKLRELCP